MKTPLSLQVNTDKGTAFFDDVMNNLALFREAEHRLLTMHEVSERKPTAEVTEYQQTAA